MKELSEELQNWRDGAVKKEKKEKKEVEQPVL